MTLITGVYSSDADILLRVSQQTFTDWADLDEDGSADPGVSDEWHNQAADIIDMYALQRGYDVSGLQSSNLIKQWSVWIAMYYGSQTRGNPPPEVYVIKYNEIIKLLEGVAAGLIQLPGVPLSMDVRPSWSNLKIDRRFCQQKIRVQQNISSDAPTTLTQNESIDVPTTYP
jgi:phage gp36-like protein